jgi:hypothetical protein
VHACTDVRNTFFILVTFMLVHRRGLSVREGVSVKVPRSLATVDVWALKGVCVGVGNARVAMYMENAWMEVLV